MNRRIIVTGYRRIGNSTGLVWDVYENGVYIRTEGVLT